MGVQVIGIVLVISALLLALTACGIIVIGISAFMLHFFPDSNFSKWLDAEVFQDDAEDDWHQNM